MNYPTHDTEWATSSKGNIWRRSNGIALVIGKRRDGKWWARRGDVFLKGSFNSQQTAMMAAVSGIDGKSSENDDEFWE
jgi:hypothetical protein